MGAKRVSIDFLETICRHEFFQSNSLGIFALNLLLADFLANFSFIVDYFLMCQTFHRTFSLSLDMLKLELLTYK